MSICPHCSQPIDTTGLAGDFLCPHCGRNLQIGTIQPPPLNVFSRSVRRRFRRATSIWDVFDWKFNKYLTPWVIRISWCLALMLGILAGASEVIQVAFDNAPERAVAQQPQWRAGHDFAPGGEWSQTGWRVLYCISRIAGVVLAVLWIRVSLEMAFVIFDIAESLCLLANKSTE